jgi:hypothetical protein
MEDDDLDSGDCDSNDEFENWDSAGDDDELPLSGEASTLLNRLIFTAKALPKHAWDADTETNFIDLYKLVPEVEKPPEVITSLMPKVNRFAYRRNKVLMKLQLNVFNLLRSSLGAVKSVGTGESPLICLDALINKMMEVYAKIERQRESEAFGFREEIQEVLDTPRGRQRVNELRERFQAMDELHRIKRVGARSSTPPSRSNTPPSDRGGGSSTRGGYGQGRRGRRNRGRGRGGGGGFFRGAGKGRAASASPGPKKTEGGSQ